MRGADVVVVGVGVMGAATARTLARRGRRVVALERFRLGHTRGSSHGRSRIFRLSYSKASYVEMAQRSLPLWRALEDEVGESLLTVTGGLDTGAGIEANAAALQACGSRFEMLDGAAAACRWPFLVLPREEPVLWQPDAGFVAADRAVLALVRSACSAGAVVREGARVERIETTGSETAVVVDGIRLAASAIVVTAGAWARAMVAPLGIELPTRPTRETVSYFRFDRVVPPSVVEWGRPAMYALTSPGQGLKVGEHAAGPAADPDATAPPSEESRARAAAWVRERFPRAEATPHLSETCLYTNAPGERFILERHGRIVVGSPCSGHGFKFAPLIGERLADLAEEAVRARCEAPARPAPPARRPPRRAPESRPGPESS